MKKAQEGPPSSHPTPEKDMLAKHGQMYSDYTLSEAYDSGKMCGKDGTLNYLQRASFWQIEQSTEDEKGQLSTAPLIIK